MRLYVSGPMRGFPHFNFPAFHSAADRLRAEGHEVFNPADPKNHRGNVDISVNNEAGDEAQAVRDYGFDLRDSLAIDLTWICRHAEGIALLPGWRDSRGAMAEYATAVALGLEIIEL